MGYVLSTILPRAAARLNDYSQTLFTSAALLPYAQDAADALQLELERKGMLVLEKVTSTPIVIPIGRTDLATTPALIPIDMLEPQIVKERLSGSTDLFQEMTRRAWTPDILPTDSLRYWDYREENIFFVGATTARDIQISYLKRLINITAITDSINVNNSQLFMITKIAALAARYSGENPSRADTLDGEAEEYLYKLTQIGTKSKQGTRTRRRPFIIGTRRRWS